MFTKAEQARFDAMKAVGAKVFSESGHLIMTDREAIAELLRPLKAMGRTERWRNAIDSWVIMVLDTDYDLAWAYGQYGIYAGYANLPV